MINANLNLNDDIKKAIMYMQQGARDFRNYKVWQDSVAFAANVYKVISQLPWFEKKGLCDQLQRAVVSIPSNIAEGAARSSDAEFSHFLDISLGSAFEVETQLLISFNVGYIDDEQYNELTAQLHNIEKQINALIQYSRKNKHP